jgi:hypothetical protein
MSNRSNIYYEFPKSLTRFNYYNFSFYYRIVRDNGDSTTSLTYSFQPSFIHDPWETIGGLDISGGPKTYTRSNTTFSYTTDSSRTILRIGLSSLSNSNSELVEFDDFSVVDVPTLPHRSTI